MRTRDRARPLVLAMLLALGGAPLVVPGPALATVTTTTARNTYTGNGAQTVFPYTYRILAATDLRVVVDGVLKTLTTDYTVSGVGVVTGGNVTFAAAPGSGNHVVIARNMPLTQTSDYVENAPFSAETLERNLDKAMLGIQQVKAEFDARGIKLTEGTALSGVTIPAPGAGGCVRWNAGGTALELIACPTPGGVSVGESFLEVSQPVVPATSAFGYTPRLFKSVDGSAALPVTSATALSPSWLLERFDATDLHGHANPNAIAFEVNYSIQNPGKSPGAGGFTSIVGTQYVSADGASYPDDVSTHVGVWGNVWILGESSNTLGIGTTSFVTIQPGSGQARAIGAEIDLANNREHAGLPIDYYTIGAAIQTGGTKRTTLGLLIHAYGPPLDHESGGAGGWLQGIYIADLIDAGPGIVVDQFDHAVVVGMELRNSSAFTGTISQANDGFVIGRIVEADQTRQSVFTINLSNGQVQIQDTTEAFPSLKTIDIGPDDSCTAGWKCLRIAN